MLLDMLEKIFLANFTSLVGRKVYGKIVKRHKSMDPSPPRQYNRILNNSGIFEKVDKAPSTFVKLPEVQFYLQFFDKFPENFS